MKYRIKPEPRHEGLIWYQVQYRNFWTFGAWKNFGFAFDKKEDAEKFILHVQESDKSSSTN